MTLKEANAYISIHAPLAGSDAKAIPRSFRRIRFQSTLPSRGATDAAMVKDVDFTGFQSTLPSRGATRGKHPGVLPEVHFNPRSPRGERLHTQNQGIIQGVFQSTLPSRGATSTFQSSRTGLRQISIHAPLAGSDRRVVRFRLFVGISIHAPLAGSDTRGLVEAVTTNTFQSTLPSRGATLPALRHHNICQHFNPRSPRGERQAKATDVPGWDQFQSTLPSRGATSPTFRSRSWSEFQSTLPSRGATPVPLPIAHRCTFQSTLPSRGATGEYGGWQKDSRIFQSTLPSRGATLLGPLRRSGQDISIHAPLAGSDLAGLHTLPVSQRISIHAPLAGSDRRVLLGPNGQDISIHAPLAGSDGPPVGEISRKPISIHAPLAGSDAAGLDLLLAMVLISIHAPLAGSDAPEAVLFLAAVDDFNPRSPRGERPSAEKRRVRRRYISIHAPLAGSDRYIPPYRLASMMISIHAPLAGSDGRMFQVDYMDNLISIHAPLAGSDGNHPVAAAGSAQFQSTLPSRGAT